MKKTRSDRSANFVFVSSLLASRDPVGGADARSSLGRYPLFDSRSPDRREDLAERSKWGHAWQSAWWTTKMALVRPIDLG